jgi:digeranylgeranylglycerophospholipid reductase
MIDVIVVGAGPAGSMAAEIVSSQGYSVQLIERKKRVGVPVQCAEGMTEFCLKNVGLPLKEEWVKQRVKGVKLMLPNNTCFYSSEPGLSVDRKIFDSWLANRAVEKGTKLKLDTTMKKIEGKAGNWKVKTSKGEFNSKVVVGADGPSSKMSRLLHLLEHREYLKAIQYKFDAKDIDFPERERFCIIMDEVYKGGYGWVFPRGDEFNVGIGGPFGNPSLLNNFCKTLKFDVNKKKEVNAGLVPFNFRFKTRSMEGVVIIGDAGGMTNPATGGGIHAALFSGKVAGELIVKALELENLKILEKFDYEIKKTQFLNPIHQRTANYFKKWTNEDWKFFGEATNGMEMKDLTLFRSFLIGLKYPRYLLRARELLTIRKDMIINQKYGW